MPSGETTSRTDGAAMDADYASALHSARSLVRGMRGDDPFEKWDRKVLLPFEESGKTGEWRWAVPQSLLDVMQGVMSPGKALRGEYELAVDPASGRVVHKGMMEDAAGLAGSLTLGAGAVPGQGLGMGFRAINREPDNPFQRWFGGSKVVDDTGAPLVVFHGSKVRGIEEFDPAKANEKTEGTGMWFSGSRDVAASHEGDAGATYPVYLNMKKPVVVEWNGHWTDGPEVAEYRIYDARGEQPFGRGWFDSEEEARAYLKRELPDGQKVEDFTIEPTFSSEGRTTDEFVRRVRRQNPDADGIILKNVGGGGEGAGDFADLMVADEYIVFSPKQIKSVDNRGTFDPNDPNILRAGGGVPLAPPDAGEKKNYRTGGKF
jgi:hypothetical protein